MSYWDCRTLHDFVRFVADSYETRNSAFSLVLERMRQKRNSTTILLDPVPAPPLPERENGFVYLHVGRSSKNGRVWRREFPTAVEMSRRKNDFYFVKRNTRRQKKEKVILLIFTDYRVSRYSGLSWRWWWTRTKARTTITRTFVPPTYRLQLPHRNDKQLRRGSTVFISNTTTTTVTAAATTRARARAVSLYIVHERQSGSLTGH